MGKKIFVALLVTSLIIVGIVLYIFREVIYEKLNFNYYNWAPVMVSDPIDKGTIEPMTSFDLTMPKGYDDGFGAADPFLVNGFVFAEIMKEGKGIIAVADSQQGALEFIPVLEEKFHLSYPHVFGHSGKWYMIPEAYQSGSILLYRANNFPYDWEKVSIIANIEGIDSTTFYLEGKWYMFTTSQDTKENMILTTNNFPLGPWHVEKSNPLPNEYRGGGQVLYRGDELFIPLQPPTSILHGYGWKLEIYKIDGDLSMKRVTTLYPPKGIGGIHHLSYDPFTKQHMVDLRRYLKRS